jgi:signal transduction protein with GAF and PtsI domain
VVDRLKLQVGRGITGWVAEHKRPVAISRDAFKDPRFQSFNELAEDRFETFLSVPVLSRDNLVGVINLQHRERHAYSQHEIRLISTIGFLVGAEIEMARLEPIPNSPNNSGQRDLQLSEEDAYLTLQKQRRQRRESLREVAEAIVLTDEFKRAQSKPETT